MLLNALWQSGNVEVQVVNGLFSVNLGDSPQPTFPETIFTDDTRYLGITVDGAELAERKRLVSVPYALNASSGIPHGVIVMWSGSQASIPTGWALCDGQNGTPNLKDRFVIAAGNTYAIGSNGGSATKNLSHTHTTGNHALTIAEMPSHTVTVHHTDRRKSPELAVVAGLPTAGLPGVARPGEETFGHAGWHGQETVPQPYCSPHETA